MPSRSLLVSVLLFLLVASIAFTTSPAHATPLPDDDERGMLASPLARAEEPQHELWDGGRGSLWFSLDFEGAVRAGAPSFFGGMLTVGIPLDRLTRGGISEGGLKPSATPKIKEPAPAPPPPEKISDAPKNNEGERKPTIPIVVTSDVARAAVDAALRKAKLHDPGARIEAMASRARSSAILPELRVRAVRRVDDGQDVVPTEYDPLRSTASVVTTTLLEARATWRLDRLVFADEEVALERLRQERAEQQSKLTTRVLEVLFAWQRALARNIDPNASPEERLDATLKTIECESTLDVLTDGWFSKWRKGA